MNEPQRRGHGRPVGSRDSYKRRALVASAIERRLGEIAVLLAELNRRHRNEHESLPAVLRRLVAIERALGLRDKIEVPKASRRRPLGRDQS
jgi:hypothetical protein